MKATDWLKNRLADRKAQIKEYSGVDARTYRHWQPDLEYAEWEIVETLKDETDYDDWQDYNELSKTKIYQETVFVQACANLEGF